MALNRLSVRQRLALIVVISLLGYASLVTVAVVSIRDSLHDSYRTSLRHIVSTGYHALRHFHAQESSGRMSRDEAQAAAKAYLRGLRFGNNDYFNLFDYQARSVMHPIRPEFEGKDQSHQRDRQGVPFVKIMVANAIAAPDGAAFQLTEFPRPGGQQAVAKLQHLRTFEPWRWILVSGVYLDDIDRAFQEKLLTFLLVAGAGMVAVVSVTVLLSRRLIGQLGGEPDYAARLLADVARGDLAVEVSVARAADDSLLAALKTSLTALRRTLAGIATGAGRVAAQTAAIAASAQHVSDASHAQAESTRAAAAAIEEMSTSIDHISASSAQTEQDSARAAALAGEGQSKAGEAAQAIGRVAGTIHDTADRIGGLLERTGQIGQVANVIKDIAAQTNLLALNAAIEAARAGESGRGFAVVADEVRGLAERTAGATVEIEQMIAAVQADTRSVVCHVESAVPQVEQGVRLAQEAAQSLEAIRSGTETTLARVRDVAVATREQSAAGLALSRQVEHISQQVEQTHEAVRQIASAVAELEQLSTGLERSVGHFRY